VKTSKKTEIVVERDQIIVVRKPGPMQACGSCGAGSPMLTVDEAASIAGVSARAIYRQIEEGRLHFLETDTGGLLICLTSVLDTI
jgi:excisionase family DNA binding protein